MGEAKAEMEDEPTAFMMSLSVGVEKENSACYQNEDHPSGKVTMRMRGSMATTGTHDELATKRASGIRFSISRYGVL